jgi:DNA-binding transcriptional LysR family regulator
MRPTMRARELDVPIRAALAQVRQALGKPHFTPETSTLTARIATSDDIELMLMSKVVGRLRTLAPGMRLIIRRVAGVFELPVEELESGALDFALGPFPRGAHQPGGSIASAAAFVDRLVCIARNGHPSVKRSPSSAQFLDASHVVVYYPASGAGIVDRLLTERGERQRKITMEVPHFSTAIFAAGQSDLLASVPSRIAKHLSGASGVRIFKFPFPAPELSYSLHWHSRHTGDPAHTWLRQLILDTAK